jgi:single stranded DNA-binding protein
MAAKESSTMSTDLNRVTMIGRLTRDVDLRQIQSGTSIASFSIANNKSYTTNGEKKEEVSFFNCICWGKQGEVFAKYVKKGHKVAVEGRLQQRAWQDNPKDNQSAPQNNNGYMHPSTGNAPMYPDAGDPTPPESFDEDEIPF